METEMKVIDEAVLAEIRAVENMVKLAGNLKPKHHVRTKLSRRETEKIIGECAILIQARLIGYAALNAAVREHEDRESISNRAQELFDAGMKAAGFNITEG